VGEARLGGGEQGIGEPVLVAHGAGQQRPVAGGGGGGDDEVAPAGGAVHLVQRAAQAPLRAGHQLVAAERGLHLAAVGPEPVGEQGGGDLRALAGLLAAVEGGDDGALHGHGGRVVAHAGHGDGGLGEGGRADHVHQA